MNKPRHDEVAACEATQAAPVETMPVPKTPARRRGVAFALMASVIGCGAAPTVTPPPPEPTPGVETPQTPELPQTPPTPETTTPPETPPVPSTPTTASPLPKPGGASQR